MSSEEHKKAEELYKILRNWESRFDDGISEENLSFLIESLKQLSSSSRTEISKLSQLASHFHPGLSVQELFNLMLPFERALQKSLRDDEFLVSEKDSQVKSETKFPLYVVLENLRSAFNVGAFFRMSEALGVEEIFLTGYTASPENEKIKKTTMGSDHWQKWKSVKSTHEAIQELKSKGIRIVAVETSDKARPIEEPFKTQPTAFIFGNERFGLGLETLQVADEVRKISLVGNKNSLNVATCGAICCHEWIRQWKKNT